MALLGEIDTFTDDVVSTVLNLCNKGCSILVRSDSHTISYGNRIRASNTSQTEITFHLTIKQLAIVKADGVPAACILNDESFHNAEVPA
jgi:hypothetical protein